MFIDNRGKMELAVALFAVAGGAWWYISLPDPAPTNQWAPATPAPQVAKVSTEVVKPKTLRVYAPAAKKQLKLPEAVQQDNNQYVVAATKLSHDFRPRTVATTVNTETGEVNTVVRREDYPWLAVEQTGELRIDYGLKNNGERVGRLSLREDFIQTKALHAGVNASLDTDRAIFVGVGVGIKW